MSDKGTAKKGRIVDDAVESSSVFSAVPLESVRCSFVLSLLLHDGLA